ncbi:MAG: ribonuclease III domain-containing protein [bacterium JZ-2024 1]
MKNTVFFASGEERKKLEFLGDAVLSFVITLELVERFGDEPLGALASAKAALVSDSFLARKAREIGLPSLVAPSHQGHLPESLLADWFEVFVGTLFIQHGFRVVRQFITSLWEKDFPASLLGKFSDVKGILQEILFAEFQGIPAYRVEKKEEGYLAKVTFKRRVLGEGEAATKKEATLLAAEAALLNHSQWYGKLKRGMRLQK